MYKRIKCPNCGECMKKENAVCKTRLICANCNLVKRTDEDQHPMLDMNSNLIDVKIKWQADLLSRKGKGKSDCIYLTLKGAETFIIKPMNSNSFSNDQEVIDTVNYKIAKLQNLIAFI